MRYTKIIINYREVLIGTGVILIFFQFTASILRLSYYMSKLIREDYKWLLLSDEQKRARYYGDEYVFIKKIENLPTQEFGLITNNGKVYYLGRYLLYPKKIYLEKSNFSQKYILIFQKDEESKTLTGSDYEFKENIMNGSGKIIGQVCIKK